MNGLPMYFQLDYPHSLNACLNWAAHIKPPQKHRKVQ